MTGKPQKQRPTCERASRRELEPGAARNGSAVIMMALCSVAMASFLALGAASIAHAQNSAPEMTLRINRSDLEVISRALDALPLSQTADTIIRIQDQIDAQPGPDWAWAKSATTVQDQR